MSGNDDDDDTTTKRLERRATRLRSARDEASERRQLCLEAYLRGAGDCWRVQAHEWEEIERGLTEHYEDALEELWGRRREGRRRGRDQVRTSRGGKQR